MAYRYEISEDDLASLRFIRDVRKEMKLTQAELGAKSGNSRTAIANLEHNRNGTTWINALVILQRLGCRIIVECPDLDRVYIVKEES